MGARRIRREQRASDQILSRHTNGFRKDKERERRDTRMIGLVKKGKFPYPPSILSWISAQLDKPGRLITEDEVQQLLR